MAFTTVTVTGDYDLADGTDPIGTVSFTPTVPMVNGTTVIAAKVTERLNIDGLLTIGLAANTDPGTLPANTSYLVEEVVGGATRSFYVQIPHDQGSTIELSALPFAVDPLPVTLPASTPPPSLTITYPAARIRNALDYDNSTAPTAGQAITWDAAGGKFKPGAVVTEGPLSLTDPRVGCVLDGAGNEAARVATAISLLPAAGGHIYHPPGILRTGAISFDRPVRWEGAGEAASVIKAASGFTGDLLTVSASAPFSRISDVGLDGGGSALNLVTITTARTKLDHLHLTAQAGSTGAAIYFNGTDANTASAHAGQLSDIRILSCGGYGVFLKAFAYDNEFTNLWVGSCNVGMRIENTDCFFSNLHVWGSTGSGVEVRGANNRFANVYIETNGSHGIDCFNAPRTKISNGSIWKNQGQGINVSTSDRVSMIGLNIYDQGSNGVNGSNSLYGQVIGCTFYDDTSSAQTQDRPIATTGTSDKWIIVDNVMLTSEHATGASSLVGSNNVVANNITS